MTRNEIITLLVGVITPTLGFLGVVYHTNKQEKLRKIAENERKKENELVAKGYFKYKLKLFKKYIDYYIQNKKNVLKMSSFAPTTSEVRAKLKVDKELFNEFLKKVSHMDWSIELLELFYKLEELDYNFQTLEKNQYNSNTILNNLKLIGISKSEVIFKEQEILDASFKESLELNKNFREGIKNKTKLKGLSSNADLKLSTDLINLVLDSRTDIFNLLDQEKKEINEYNFYAMREKIKKIESMMEE